MPSATSNQVSSSPTNHGHPHTAIGPVDHQQDRQHGNRAADMVGIQEQDVGTGTHLRREHDPRGEQHADDRLPSGGTALREQCRKHYQQGVGRGGSEVHDVSIQAADGLNDHVLG
jgi:hypothetical protein